MKHTERFARLVADATRRGGVLTRRQADAAGAGNRSIRSMECSGIILRRHPGVRVVAARAGDHAVLRGVIVHRSTLVPGARLFRGVRCHGGPAKYIKVDKAGQV